MLASSACTRNNTNGENKIISKSIFDDHKIKLCMILEKRSNDSQIILFLQILKFKCLMHDIQNLRWPQHDLQAAVELS